MSTESISSSPVQYQPPVLSDQIKDIIPEAIRVLKGVQLFTNSQPLRNRLEQLQAKDLEDVLEVLIHDFVMHTEEYDPMVLIERLSKLLSLEKIQLFKKCPSDLFKKAKDEIKAAKYYFENSQTVHSPTVKALISDVLEGLIRTLESFIMAFGMAQFFEKPKDKMEGMFKAQHLMMVLSLLGVVTSMIIPLVGPKIGSIVIGGTLLGITGISLIYAKVKPKPKSIANGTAVTDQYDHGLISTSGVRKHVKDQVMAVIKNGSSGFKQHPLVLAPSGTGKSTLVQDLAVDLRTGVYGEEFKDCAVFSFNSGKLVSQAPAFGGSNESLPNISQEIGRHKNKIFVVLDEVHAFCEADEKKLDEQLKTLLDPNPDSLVYVIGLTTYADYYRAVESKNNALIRRFYKIDMPNTSADETLLIANNYLLKYEPEIIASDGMMKELYIQVIKEFGDSAPQPGTMLNALIQCTSKIKISNATKNEVEHQSFVQAERTAISTSVASESDFAAVSAKVAVKSQNSENSIEYTHAELEQKIKELKKLVDEDLEKKRVAKVQSRLRLEAKTSAYKIALMAEKFNDQETAPVSYHRSLKEYALVSGFLIPMLSKLIQSSPIPTFDKALITSAISELKKGNEAVQKGIQDGKLLVNKT